MSDPHSLSVEVIVQNHCSEAASPVMPEQWQEWFQVWLTDLQDYLPSAAAYELSLRLTGDRDIQALNTQYRHKDQPTDVLSFATLEVDYPELDDPDFADPIYLGDIVISVETAERQAWERQHTVRQELIWLAAHGLLHLLGWDHPDTPSLLEMLDQQAELLSAIGVAIAYDRADYSEENC